MSEEEVTFEVRGVHISKTYANPLTYAGQDPSEREQEFGVTVDFFLVGLDDSSPDGVILKVGTPPSTDAPLLDASVQEAKSSLCRRLKSLINHLELAEDS